MNSHGTLTPPFLVPTSMNYLCSSPVFTRVCSCKIDMNVSACAGKHIMLLTQYDHKQYVSRDWDLCVGVCAAVCTCVDRARSLHCNLTYFYGLG